MATTDRPIIWRGSVSDFVTDLKSTLTAGQLRLLATELVERGIIPRGLPLPATMGQGGSSSMPPMDRRGGGASIGGAAWVGAGGGTVGEMGPAIGGNGKSKLPGFRVYSSTGEDVTHMFSHLERDCPEHGTTCHGAHCDYREDTVTAQPPLPKEADPGSMHGRDECQCPVCLPHTRDGQPRARRAVPPAEVKSAGWDGQAEATREAFDAEVALRGDPSNDKFFEGPCPPLCSCDESRWLRGRLRSVSRRALIVHEYARGGAEAGK